MEFMQSARMNGLFFLLLLAVQFRQFQPGQSEKVPCPDQQEACDCPASFTTCEFELQIEELQTFTSYAKDQNGDLLIRGTPGDVYFLDSTGYHPSVPSNSNSPERQGRCYLEGSLINVEDFTSRNCSIPMTVDGVSYRRYIAVNGRIPGPTLIVTEDKLVKVRVYNRLTSEGITIHWHGMHQRNTPWMDGVGFISQYPIGPGAFFDYVFRATPAGTHWYHSHVGAQRTDGLFGGLVVREKDNRFRNIIEPLIMPEDIARGDNIIDLPENHTLTLLDWQREASLDLFVKIHSTLGFYRMTNLGDVPMRNSEPDGRSRSADGVEVGPVPYWSGLINGRGRRASNIYTPLSEFTVTHESVYRFRIIGAQSLYAYKFSIDQHTLRVIATDGHFITPVDVDFIIVHSGERYDFLVDTNNISPNNYWIRAQTLEQGEDHSALAVLKYSTAPIDWTNRYSGVTSSSRDCTQQPCVVLNCPFRNDTNYFCIHLTDLTPLIPLSNEDLPEFTTTADNVKFFNFGFEGESTTSAVSGRNFQLPITPYQTNCGQFARDQRDTNDNVDTCNKCMQESSSADCKCTYVEKIAENEKFKPGQEPTIMMVFSATGDHEEGLNSFSHPIHLHGHSFHIVHIGHGRYFPNGTLQGNSPDIDCRGDLMCRNPQWTGGVIPIPLRNKAGANGRIRNTAIQKDTVIVPAGGYVVVAFKADNPGYWFLHCHIEVHQLEGMGVLIEEYPYTQHSCPPNKIEEHGNFEWTFVDYNNHKGTCSAYAIKPLSILTLIYIMATAMLY